METADTEAWFWQPQEKRLFVVRENLDARVFRASAEGVGKNQLCFSLFLQKKKIFKKS